MQKFSIQQKLNQVLFLQPFKANPSMYGSLGVSGHIGVDFSIGDGDPFPAVYDGTIVYTQPDTIVQLTPADSSGRCLEVSYAHGKNQKVKVGDSVKVGQVLFDQDSTGPSVMWKDGDVDKVAWSHVHISIREAYLTDNPPAKNYRWNYQAFSPIKYAVVETDPTIEHFLNPNDFNAQVIDTFIKGIADHEGFLNGTSRIAIECNNPGNMRYSPIQDGQRNYGTKEKPNIFAYFNTVEKGWQALRNDIAIKASGHSEAIKKALGKYNASVLEFCHVYSPVKDGNLPLAYAKSLVSYCGLRGINDPLSDILLTEFEWMDKYNQVKYLAFPEQDNQIDPSGRLAGIVTFFKYLANIIHRN